MIALVERVQTRGMPSRVMANRAVIEGLLGKTGSAGSQQADRAGLLVGRLTSDSDGIIITVFDTVELPDVPLRAEPPGLLIALADDLRREARASHAGREIIGWFHTHSDSGVSPSEEDAMVHRSLSSLGAGIALIVDVVQRQASFFYMDGEALLPFAGYYMFDPVGESREQSPSAPAAQASGSQTADELRKCVRLSPVTWLRRLRWLLQRPSNDTSLALRLASIALIIASIALAAQIWTPRSRIEQIAVQPLPGPRAKSRAEPESLVPPQAGPEPQAEPRPQIGPEAMLPAAPQPIPQAQQATDQDNASRPTVKPGAPGTVTVTVAPGESVAVITERLYGRATDERMREILAMNGIADPRKIAPGTILVCPAPPPVVAPSVAPNIEPDVEPDIEPSADPGADPGPDLTPAPQSSSSGQS
ncbi:MAG: hypothetical protein KA063_01760 [Firmicutes bacterium]|nr:hypothetical protein [Bacillota bacterium]